MPINASYDVALWPRFDEESFLDFCPSVMQLNGQNYVAFRRNTIPPQWGKGQIWIVKVDDALLPTEAPRLIIECGEDPRILVVGNRVFLMYVNVEFTSGAVSGSHIYLAEIDIENDYRLIQSTALPKSPVGSENKPQGSFQNFEKNWVPFKINEDTLGILYSHDPWVVLELSIKGAVDQWRFTQCHMDKGIQWGYGDIRGGSVPVPFSETEDITFFHSSTKVGQKKIYFGGACVYLNTPPYTPKMITPEPLMISPYKPGSETYGWALGQPIIFPLGLFINNSNNFDLLCSINDAFIGKFSFEKSYIQAQLVEYRPMEKITVHEFNHVSQFNRKNIYIGSQSFKEFFDPVYRFFHAIKIEGTRFIDFGQDSGAFLLLFSQFFMKCTSIAPQGQTATQRHQMMLINDLKQIDVVEGENFLSDFSPYLEDIQGDSVLIKLDINTPYVVFNDLVNYILSREWMLLLVGVDIVNNLYLHNKLKNLKYKVVDLSQTSSPCCLCIPSLQQAKYSWFV